MFSSKTKTLFIECNPFSILLAVSDSAKAPFMVEGLYEFNSENPYEQLKEFVDEMAMGKTVRFAPAVISSYPPGRFLRRHTLENMAKAKDPLFFKELITQQYRIDSEAGVMFEVINAANGQPFDGEKALSGQKELLICGTPKDSIVELQKKIVSMGIYPESIELGEVAMLGALQSLLKQIDYPHPILFLDLSHNTADLAIISKDMLEVTRPIPFGLNAMLPLIQKELGLKDEGSAKKLLFSNTFDFTEMGPVLLTKVLKELQSSTGFYEVQTGQTIGAIFLPHLPDNLGWVQHVLSRSLGVDPLELSMSDFLEAQHIQISELADAEIDERWLGLFSLMGDYVADLKDIREKE